LDSAGRVPGGEIWLTDGLVYKFVIETATSILIGTYDNITGVNSNFINYTVQEEVITATAGQTVFNLSTINYTPGTNSLTVYIDGVNQYVGDSYLETDSDTVTFTAGLHVGAEVKFTTATQINTGATDAALVSYIPPFLGGVGTDVEAKLAQYVSVKDFGAVGDGVADDTAAIQAALNFASSVFLPDGTYLITDSLYMLSDGQEFSGTGIITMNAGLGKPALYIGAQDASGTPVAAAILNVKVRDIRFLGTGTKTIGSAGVCFVKATTTTLDSIYCWGWHGGITVTGLSIINTFINPDLRYNTYGVYDPSTNPMVSDLQGSQFFGGRIEANEREGVLIGSPNIKFIGSCIEGNGQVANGGDGTSPEVTITGGSTGGNIEFHGCYMETAAANTSEAMIEVAIGSIPRYVSIIGGEYFASDAASRFIIKSRSTSTTQSFLIEGGLFSGFLNYVSATISGNSAVQIAPTFATEAPVLSDDVTATGGAALWQWDRAFGVRTNQQFLSDNTNGIQASKITLTAAAASNSIAMTTGSLVQLGGTGRTIWSDGTNINVGVSNVNVILGGAQSNVSVGQLQVGVSGPQIFSGSAAPTFSATKGSLYLRTGGGAGSTFYVNESGSTTWTAK
jgi:hypothetical protein